MIIIETNRLVLRPHSIADFAGYAQLWATMAPEPPGTPLRSREETWARLLRFVGHWSVFGFGPFMVVDRATNSVIGEVGFAHFHRGNGASFDGFPEAMWMIDRPFHGKGFAAEAVQAAIKWFDSEQFAKRTVCMIRPENIPSLKIAELFGFHPFTRSTYRGDPILLLERLRE